MLERPGAMPARSAASAGSPILNLRDVGGRRTRDGRLIAPGIVFRSADIGAPGDDGPAALARLGIRTVYDLRTAEERLVRPDRLPDGAVLVIADVLESSPDASPARLTEILEDPRRAAAYLGGGVAAAMFPRKYREFVLMASARAAYGRLFGDLAAASTMPALFHCTTGKDRTGWAAAALLLLLDVEPDEVMRDYLASNDAIEPAFRPLLDRFAARGGDPELLRPLMEVREEYLASALDAVAATFGSIESYFERGLGIEGPALSRLRATLLEAA